LDGDKKGLHFANNNICDHLEKMLAIDRSPSRPMKKTHVFPFDEAQVLLATHAQFEVFLFRCIRTWLLKERDGRTAIAAFSGTSSGILNFTIESDLLNENDSDDFYSRGTAGRTFESFFADHNRSVETVK
jgi:hypothetical protein